MKCLLLRRADAGSVGGSALRELLRVIAQVSRQSQSEIFAHVHPHAHATASLARHFADRYVCGGTSRAPTIEEIEFGAQMHDIGKYFIAPSILLKPGMLDEEERAIVSLHSIYGATVISKIPGTTETIRRVVLYHHEHWDGTGYPEGLSGTNIPLAARIISVVDAYTSLRARRSYKPALSKWEACKTLIEMAGRELDPFIVEDFIRLLGYWEQVDGWNEFPQSLRISPGGLTAEPKEANRKGE